MKEDIKKRWVKALRSGDYKQGTNMLRNGDSFCCLGVLCDVVKDDMGLDWDTGKNGQIRFGGSAYDLTPEVVEHIGGSRNPLVDVEGQDDKQALSWINDSGIYSFEQIADLIEEQL